MKTGIDLTIHEFCEVCTEDEGYGARVFDIRIGEIVFSGSLEDVMNCRYANRELWGVSLVRNNIIEFDIFTEEE